MVINAPGSEMPIKAQTKAASKFHWQSGQRRRRGAVESGAHAQISRQVSSDQPLQSEGKIEAILFTHL